jgi:LemA protein
VVRLRNEAQRAGEDHPAARGHAEAALGQALGGLFALAENYPDLKASTNFLDFQNTLEEVENQIQFARRYYNGAVRQLNVMIEQFPSNLVANAAGFTRREYFELESPQEAAVPQISLQGGAS